MYFGRFSSVHIGDPSPNRVTSIESKRFTRFKKFRNGHLARRLIRFAIASRNVHLETRPQKPKASGPAARAADWRSRAPRRDCRSIRVSVKCLSAAISAFFEGGCDMHRVLKLAVVVFLGAVTDAGAQGGRAVCNMLYQRGAYQCETFRMFGIEQYNYCRMIAQQDRVLCLQTCAVPRYGYPGSAGLYGYPDNPSCRY